MVLAFEHLRQTKECWSSKIWMHQQNIMLAFLPAPKLVMETTVKVKDFLRMDVSTTWECRDLVLLVVLGKILLRISYIFHPLYNFYTSSAWYRFLYCIYQSYSTALPLQFQNVSNSKIRLNVNFLSISICMPFILCALSMDITFSQLPMKLIPK